MNRFSSYAVLVSASLAAGILLIAAQPTSAQADRLLAAGLDSYQAQRYAEAESDLAQAAESFQAAGIRNLGWRGRSTTWE